MIYFPCLYLLFPFFPVLFSSIHIVMGGGTYPSWQRAKVQVHNLFNLFVYVPNIFSLIAFSIFTTSSDTVV